MLAIAVCDKSEKEVNQMMPRRASNIGRIGSLGRSGNCCPPHISLEFRLTDDTGNVVSAGKREISNNAYQARLVRPPDDYQRCEKDILRDWFRNEFSGQERAAQH